MVLGSELQSDAAALREPHNREVIPLLYEVAVLAHCQLTPVTSEPRSYFCVQTLRTWRYARLRIPQTSAVRTYSVRLSVFGTTAHCRRWES